MKHNMKHWNKFLADIVGAKGKCYVFRDLDKSVFNIRGVDFLLEKCMPIVKKHMEDKYHNGYWSTQHIMKDKLVAMMNDLEKYMVLQ